MIIDISGIDKPSLLAALWNNAQRQGLGFLQRDWSRNDEMSYADAARLIDCNKSKGLGLRFDYEGGRVLKVDISGNEMDGHLYDRDNGQDSAAGIVSSLRGSGEVSCHSSHPAPEDRVGIAGFARFTEKQEIFEAKGRAVQPLGNIGDSFSSLPNLSMGNTFLCHVNTGFPGVSYYVEIGSDDDIKKLIERYGRVYGVQLQLFSIKSSLLGK